MHRCRCAVLVAFQEGGLFGRYYYILLSTEYSGSGQLLFVFSVQRCILFVCWGQVLYIRPIDAFARIWCFLLTFSILAHIRTSTYYYTHTYTTNCPIRWLG